MRISSISITNMAGLKSFESKLGSVCIISGPHGSGKSSIERCVMYSLGRRPLAEKGSRSVQHDPGMLHAGSDKGEAIVTFDAESPVEHLRVVVSADKTSRYVKTRGSKRWEDAGPVIDDITNALAYDPMQFKDLSPKDRLEAFLRVVPVEITREEIAEASGRLVGEIPEKPGLDTINEVYDYIYKNRTAENTAADTQEKHAAQLEAALPPVVEGGDWNAEAKRLREEKATLEASETEEIKRIGKELQVSRDKHAAERRTAEGVIDKEIGAKLGGLETHIQELQARITELQIQQEVLKGEANTRKSALAQVETEANEVARGIANVEAGEVKTLNAPLHAKLLTDIATADERARGTAQAEGTRKAAAVARVEAESRKTKSKAMTEALERLTKLKASVAGRMVVKGVTIASPREGLPVDICREEDGALVPFSSWNSASQDEFCIRMAVLYSGTFGLVCIDNMANWSVKRREEIIATCRKYDKMQWLLGLATDSGELSVKEA